MLFRSIPRRLMVCAGPGESRRGDRAVREVGPVTAARGADVHAAATPPAIAVSRAPSSRRRETCSARDTLRTRIGSLFSCSTTPARSCRCTCGFHRGTGSMANAYDLTHDLPVDSLPSCHPADTLGPSPETRAGSHSRVPRPRCWPVRHPACLVVAHGSVGPAVFPVAIHV